MTFLPIVVRELRVASRRRSTYWQRSGTALAVMAIGAWLFFVMQHEPPHRVAQFLFGLLTGGAVLYCLFSGVRYTADCLSEEKREGTLGLLFLTDLKGYDVVSGKLAATSLNSFYGVLAVVPMLALPLLLGGVTPGEFGRMALVAINTLFFSLAAGICVSALCRNARRAMGMTFLLILLFAAVCPAIWAWLAFVGRAKQVSGFFLLPSAGCNYYTAFDATYNTMRQARLFWGSLLLVHSLGWIFLALASVIAPRTWQDRPAEAQRLRWKERLRLWSYGGSAERAAFRRELLDQNAYFWLVARGRFKPALVWAVLTLLAGGWAWGLAKYHRDWLSEFMCLITGALLNVLLKGWVASETGRQLAEDRTQGTLELLLSTPMTVHDLLRGQLLALKRQFLGPLIVVLAAFLAFMMATASLLNEADDRASWILFWLALMLLLVADLTAIYWVGMWQGLTARIPNRATGNCLSRILIVPWVVVGIVLLLLGLISLNSNLELGPKFFLVLWVGLSLAADIGFGAWSRHKLLTEFRLAATQRYTPQAGFWKRLLNGGPS